MSVEEPMSSPTGASRARAPKRRWRAFSLNALAIQLSAFALSFTLVALLVVSGSHEAFVEPVESGKPWVAPTTTPATPVPPAPVRPRPTAPTEQPVEEPEPEPEPEPVQEPPLPVDVAVQLVDDGAGTAMFTGGQPLSPGASSTRCIEVSYSGGADPGPVVLYAAGTSGDLPPYLQLSVEIGPSTDNTFGSCAGFTPSAVVYTGTVADFAANHFGYVSGRSAWQPTTGDSSRSFRFSVSVQSVPAAMGKSATFGFTWEVRG